VRNPSRLRPDQQPEAVAESEPIAVASRSVKLPVYVDELVLSAKARTHPMNTSTDLAGKREDPLCGSIFLRTKPYCIVLR
jgi:hypothetical protein